jgi:hypothetical protein
MAKHNKKKSRHLRPLYTHSLEAPKERKAQNGGVVSETIYEKSDGKIYTKRQRATAECLIDYYFWRGRIDALEREAGLIFRRAYQRAVLHIQTDDYGSGSHGDYEAAMLVVSESARRIKSAYSVLSPKQSDIIITVCGFDDWVGSTARFKTFRRGLQKLAALWRLNI